MEKQSKAGTPTKFIVMRKEILKDKSLSSTDKIVYARICSFDEYFESAERCGELLGMTAWQVQKSRRKLELSGYIRCIENTGRGKKYQAVYDLPKTVGLSGKNSNSDWKKQQLRVEKSTTLIGKIDNSESKKTHTYNKVENKVENKGECRNCQKAVPTCAPEAYELAEKLHQMILDNKPNRKIDKDWRDNWANAIDKLHRIDKREWSQIGEVITFSQKDSFWWRNILSGITLRKQFDRLEDDAKGMREREITFLKLS